MEHYELRILADYVHTGVQVANTWARPSPRTVSGELERDERAEVVFAEIFPPVTGIAEELLRKVIPVLDGQRYSEYVSLSGILSSNMVPPRNSVWGGRLYSFGAPHNSNALLSTTLKYSEHITVECLAGNANINADYRVRLWGYVYKVAELPTVFGTMMFAPVIERARGRTLPLAKSPIPVTGASWKTLPGGKDQRIPKINPLIRFAYNLLATDGIQGDYQFRYDTGRVSDSDENLYFDFDDLDALVIESIGVRPDGFAGNLARAGLSIAGDYHPKGLIPTTWRLAWGIGDNPLHFGLVYPFIHYEINAPQEIPFWYAIPKLDKQYLVWNEKGLVVIRDDGVAAVAINGVVVCLTGIRIEMHG
ncbi:hypothetical protein ES703_75147 [subsurface metagenome]